MIFWFEFGYAFLNLCHLHSAFADDLANDCEKLKSRLQRDRVSVVICSGISDSFPVRFLLDIIAEDIQVYPPIQCQMRSIVVPRVLEYVMEDTVVLRMTYVGRVRLVMHRSQSKHINIFYQVLEYPDGRRRLKYGMDYFGKDAVCLKNMIKCNPEVCNMPELKCDPRVRANVAATSSLVFKMTFFTIHPGTSPIINQAAKGRWSLEHIRIWPSCGIDIIPNNNVMVSDAFYVVTEHLGMAVFGYLDQYGTVGRTPV